MVSIGFRRLLRGSMTQKSSFCSWSCLISQCWFLHKYLRSLTIIFLFKAWNSIHHYICNSREFHTKTCSFWIIHGSQWINDSSSNFLKDKVLETMEWWHEPNGFRSSLWTSSLSPNSFIKYDKTQVRTYFF